jgi:hypothetical protein
MFHTYVLGHHKPVDFDRASYLMDKELLKQALDALEAEKNGKNDPPIKSNSDAAQFVWDYYVNRHFEKYGESFAPNADPHWDT